MAEAAKKKGPALYTHWARPRVRTYEYNYEYGESYYRPQVRYISTTRALSSSSSSVQLDTRRSRLERRRRGPSPPGALSFIERWSDEPFYGYGIGFRSRAGRASSEQVASSSASYDLESSSARSTVAAFRARSERARSVSRERSVVRESSASRALSVARESSVSRAQSVARESSMSVARESVARAQSIAREQSLMARAQSVARAESVSRSLQRDESLLSSMDLRSQRARAIDIASRYASDDCLMRSNALDAAYGVSARALSASREILNTNSLTRRTLALDSQNVLHGRTLDERYYALYPKQHLVCPENCPLHNNPDWRRRFLIGNRFLDAAALGGFDVLYDPSVYKNSRRLLARLAESSEYDTEEISYERSAQSESSRRRMRATASMA